MVASSIPLMAVSVPKRGRLLKDGRARQVRTPSTAASASPRRRPKPLFGLRVDDIVGVILVGDRLPPVETRRPAPSICRRSRASARSSAWPRSRRGARVADGVGGSGESAGSAAGDGPASRRSRAASPADGATARCRRRAQSSPPASESPVSPGIQSAGLERGGEGSLGFRDDGTGSVRRFAPAWSAAGSRRPRVPAGDRRTRVARRAGTRLASSVTPVPRISEMTTVCARDHRRLLGNSKPSAAINAPACPARRRARARAQPDDRGQQAQHEPFQADRAHDLLARGGRAYAWHVANSRAIRWATVIGNAARSARKITRTRQTSSAMRAKPSTRTALASSPRHSFRAHLDAGGR